MDEFVQVFGEVSVGKVVVVLSALAFIWKIYDLVKKHLKSKWKEEEEKEKRIQSVLEQASHYPEWRKQSIDIREALNDKINEIMTAQSDSTEKLETVIRHIYESEATTCRYRILHFNDEVLHGARHTKEHFDQILDDITRYERYCDEHPEYENNKAVLAIGNIKRVYQKCNDEVTFL